MSHLLSRVVLCEILGFGAYINESLLAKRCEEE